MEILGQSKCGEEMKKVQIVNTLIDLLNNYKNDVKCSAIIGLGKIRDHRATEPLIGILKKRGESEGVVIIAAWALGEINDKRAIIPLRELIKKKTLWTEKIPIIEALGKIGDDRCVEPLIDILYSAVESSFLSTPRRISKASLEALKSIILRFFEKMKNNHLERIVNLPNSIPFEYCTHSPSSFLPSHFDTVTIDCSVIKEVAKKELMCRHNKSL